VLWKNDRYCSGIVVYIRHTRTYPTMSFTFRIAISPTLQFTLFVIYHVENNAADSHYPLIRHWPFP